VKIFQNVPFAQEIETAQTVTTTRFDLASHFPEWMQKQFAGVAIWQFISAVAFVLLGLVLKKISDYLFEKKIIPLFKRTRFDFNNLFLEALSKPFGFLILIGGIACTIVVLPLPAKPDINGFILGALKIAVAFNFLWFLFRLVDIAAKYLGSLAERTESKLDDQLIPLINRSLKVTIGVISFLWIIQLLGYNISSLLTGLGIGGLAVALALQDTLSNFFGSIFIFLDRPFMVGDWIKIGDVEGIVEEIGFRSTRIRTWFKTLVSMPNKNVANATIDNLSKMPKRRVSQVVGVTYQTSAEQMEQAVSSIKKILENEEHIDQEFILVRFTDFGASSLNITVIYFTKDVGFAEHVEVKEKINLAIMRKLKELGLSIAFPTMSIYLENEDKVSGNALKTERKSQKKENKEEDLPLQKT